MPVLPKTDEHVLDTSEPKIASQSLLNGRDKNNNDKLVISEEVKQITATTI